MATTIFIPIDAIISYMSSYIFTVRCTCPTTQNGTDRLHATHITVNLMNFLTFNLLITTSQRNYSVSAQYCYSQDFYPHLHTKLLILQEEPFLHPVESLPQVQNVLRKQHHRLYQTTLFAPNQSVHQRK